MTDMTIRFCKTKCVKVRSRTEDGQAYEVTVAGDDELARKYTRTVPWGDFDEGIVTWQAARARAIRYANQLAAHLRPYHMPIPDREPDGKFHTFQTWVCKATSWIGGTNPLCVDAKDRILTCGGDFARADKEGAFPVRFWFDAGPETPREHAKSKRRAEKAMRLNYPWRYSR